MKTKRFDFNFKPLQLKIAISADGSVADRQNYNADADEYTPDYTLTPAILQPSVSRLDKDEIVSPGSVNAFLTNIRWYVIEGGVRTQILSAYDAATNPYSYVTSGEQAGRISIRRNVLPNVPITLEFNADYVDSRTGQVISIRRTHIIKCSNSTVYSPVLLLDAADQTIYNPLKDPDSQTVQASLRRGTAECPAADRLFVWEVLRSDGSFTAVGADNSDYWVTVANNGASITINRKLMGQQQIIRCRAKYDPEGNPGSVTLTGSAPTAIVAFVRRLPKYEYDYSLPTNIPPGLRTVYPEIYVYDVNGTLANAQNILLPIWYIGTNRANGTPANYTQVAHGYAPGIPTGAMSELYGAVIGLDVKDPGPFVPWLDGAGGVFMDADGAVLLIK